MSFFYGAKTKTFDGQQQPKKKEKNHAKRENLFSENFLALIKGQNRKNSLLLIIAHD